MQKKSIYFEQFRFSYAGFQKSIWALAKLRMQEQIDELGRINQTLKFLVEFGVGSGDEDFQLLRETHSSIIGGNAGDDEHEVEGDDEF